MILDVLLGEEGTARCHLPDEWQNAHACRLAQGAVGGRTLPAEELERPRLGRVATDVSRPFEVGQVCVHSRRRSKPHLFADLTHRGWISVLVDVGDDIVINLALTVCEHRFPPLRTNVCSEE